MIEGQVSCRIRRHRQTLKVKELYSSFPRCGSGWGNWPISCSRDLGTVTRVIEAYILRTSIKGRDHKLVLQCCRQL
jgi:hypothetical protein